MIEEVAEPVQLPSIIDDKGRRYRELRCDSCHALICYEYIYNGRVLIKCWRCAKMKLMVFSRNKKRKRSSHEEKKG